MAENQQNTGDQVVVDRGGRKAVRSSLSSICFGFKNMSTVAKSLPNIT